MNTCAECRFWQRLDEPLPSWLHAVNGKCRLFGDEPTIGVNDPPVADKPTVLAFVAQRVGSIGATFITNENFGCVQFEHADARSQDRGDAAAWR